MDKSKRINKNEFALEIEPSFAGGGGVHFFGHHYGCPINYKPKNTITAGCAPDVRVEKTVQGIILHCECGATSELFTIEECKIAHPFFG